MRNAFLALLVAVIASHASDWPQFLGPQRNGASPDQIASAWPKEGPAMLWQKPAGQGWSSPVVASDKLILFHRVANNETIECLDAMTGATVWTNSYPATFRDTMGFESGPRATPVIAADKIFTYGADGIISAIDLNGKTIWRIDAKKEYGSPPGYFGRAASPIVVNGLLVVNVGAPNNSGSVALETATGKLAWKTSDDEASYSSPALFNSNSVLFLTRNELIALQPATGAIQFRQTHKPRISASVTAATPLAASNQIFITASYGAGAVALRVDDKKPTQLWSDDQTLSSHYATPVHRNGQLYGFHGRQEETPALVCVDWQTGKTAWRKENFGSGTIILARDKLLILLETGELILARAAAAKYEELARAQILGSDSRAHAALAEGCLYARDKTKLIKVNLR